MANHVQNGMNRMNSAVMNSMNSMTSIMISSTSRINSIFSGLTSTLSNIGYNAGIGLRNGLANSAGSIYATANNIASNVARTMRKALDIHSPSRVTDKIGGFVGMGLVNGMSRMQKQVDRQALAYATSIKSQEYEANSVLTADTRNVSNKLSSSMNELSEEVKTSQLQEPVFEVHTELVGDKIYTIVKQKEARNQNKVNLVNKK